MKYAINVADLLGQKDNFPLMLLVQPVISTETAHCEGDDRMDGEGVLMSCEESRAEAIVDLIRMKFKKHQFRIYQSRTGSGGWKRV